VVLIPPAAHGERWSGVGGRIFVFKEISMEFPECKKCNDGLLLPLSDYGREGATIRYKAWVCHNPTCGFSIRIDNGEISLGKEIRVSVK
jgi:hypothetical protein